MDYRHKNIHKGGDDDVNEELIDEKFGQWKQAVKNRDKAHRKSIICTLLVLFLRHFYQLC